MRLLEGFIGGPCSLIFLEIVWDNSLEHFLTTSRGKTHKKNFFWWGGGAKFGSELRVFVIF